MIAPRDGEGFTAVIGGGGAMAIGISAGILMALKDAGLDVADAAATIGTSAGSTVAAGSRVDRHVAEACAGFTVRVQVGAGAAPDSDQGRRRSEQGSNDDETPGGGKNRSAKGVLHVLG